MFKHDWGRKKGIPNKTGEKGGGKAEPLVPRLIWPPCHLVAVKILFYSVIYTVFVHVCLGVCVCVCVCVCVK